MMFGDGMAWWPVVGKRRRFTVDGAWELSRYALDSPGRVGPDNKTANSPSSARYRLSIR